MKAKATLLPPLRHFLTQDLTEFPQIRLIFSLFSLGHDGITVLPVLCGKLAFA